jgi:DNA polymerase-3 subunit delta
VKASAAQVRAALKAGAGDIRFFLFHGPDDSGSRELLREIGAAAGEGAERVDLSGAQLASDPARLADEAASLSLFGSTRYIVVDPAGDESVAAAEALIEAPSAGDSVVLIAGALKPSSRLLKLALAAPCAMAVASYVPDAREADRIVIELGRANGLTVRPDVARRIAEAAGGNRAVVARELEKLACFLDAAPERPKPLEPDALDAVGAGSEEGDTGRLVEAVMRGDSHVAEAELARLSSEGIEGVPVIRAMLRRIALLARLRAAVEAGASPASAVAGAGKAIFWKEKDAVTAQVARWRSGMLAKAVDRLVDAERQVKESGSVGPIAAEAELLAICRQAARLR